MNPRPEQGQITGSTRFAPSPAAISAAQPNCSSACAATQTAAASAAVSGVQPEFNSGNNGSLDTPCIYWNGNCVNGQTIEVSAGQQIVLVGYLPPADQPEVTSQGWYWGAAGGGTSWGDPGGAPSSNYAVGCSSSYTGSSTPQNVTSPPYATCSGSNILPTSASPPPSSFNVSTDYPLPDLSNPSEASNYTGSTYTFWWTANPGAGVSNTLYFDYSESADQADPAWVTFTVDVPTNVSVLTCGGTVYSPGCNNSNKGTVGTTDIVLDGSTPYLQFGGTTTNQGIVFTPSVSTNVSYLQIIESYDITYDQMVGGVCYDDLPTPALDTSYPYGTGPYVDDNPGVPLLNDTEVTISSSTPFSAQMYVLWTPGSTNSIPVPLGYVPWTWSAAATPGSSCSGGADNWCPSGTGGNASSFVSSSTYPQWTQIIEHPTPTCN